MDLGFLSDFANGIQTAAKTAGAVINLGQQAGFISPPRRPAASQPPVMPGQTPGYNFSDPGGGSTAWGWNYPGGWGGTTGLTMLPNAAPPTPQPSSQPNTLMSKLTGGSTILIVGAIGAVVVFLAMRK